MFVVVDSCDVAKAVTQRWSDTSHPRRRPDKREGRQVDLDRSSSRPLSDHDVELEVLHRRVEHLFYLARKTVDFIDEENVARFEIRNDGCDVPRTIQRRPGGSPKLGVHLGRQDAGERRLSEPGWPGEEHMVDRLAASPGRLDQDREAFLQGALADKLVHAVRPQADIDRLVLRRWIAGEQTFVSHRSLCFPSTWSDRRSMSLTGRSGGRSLRAPLISSG